MSSPHQAPSMKTTVFWDVTPCSLPTFQKCLLLLLSERRFPKTTIFLYFYFLPPLSFAPFLSLFSFHLSLFYFVLLTGFPTEYHTGISNTKRFALAVKKKSNDSTHGRSPATSWNTPVNSSNTMQWGRSVNYCVYLQLLLPWPPQCSTCLHK
jgi:hypothetical protein